VIIRFPEDRAHASNDVTLARVEEAAQRIAPYIRRTPTLCASFELPSGDWRPLHLKLENLQNEGGVELRGVLNAALRLPPEAVARGLVSVSGGGSHSQAVVATSELLRVPVWVHAKRAKLTTELSPVLTARGASVVIHNASWAAIERAAERQASRDGLAFINPLTNPDVIAGLGTVGLEMLAAPARPALVVVPANSGGGAALVGVAVAVKTSDPSVRVVGVEVTRAPRLYQSSQLGRLVSLAPIPGYSGPIKASELVFDLCRRYVDDIVLVSPEEARDAVRRLFREADVTASASGATALAALLSGKVLPPVDGNTYALIGGSGEAGLF
jgi:threonine dehydratase